MKVSPLVETSNTLEGQATSPEIYSDDERKTLRDAASILRKRHRTLGAQAAGSPVNEMMTREGTPTGKGH